MNMWESFLVGIAPDHWPALMAAILLPVGIWVVRRLRGPLSMTGPGPQPAREPLSLLDKWIAVLLAVTAVVHLALPLGHHDEPVLLIGFVGSGVAWAWLAMRVVERKRYRLMAIGLAVATLIGYLVIVGGGNEEADQVGIATALDELAIIAFCMVPTRRPGRPRRFARFAASGGTIFVVVVVGAVIWIGSFLAHAATGKPTQPSAASGEHNHAHEHAARAQAGIITHPHGGEAPTAEQKAAADKLAADTRAATAKYADVRAALAAGYRMSLQKSGASVHMERKANQKDGKILDPNAPEQLVYAIEDGKATLLGVVYQMPTAGVPGPAIGGPLTSWHSHNICGSVVPPGIGIVSPFGGCPVFSVDVTIPEMMHVWVVDNPNGAFAEGLDDKWVKEFNLAHGVPWNGQ
jgi:hypothetical protein